MGIPTKAGGGVPQGRYSPPDRTADGVLDTLRLVCLLRSRRRTFLSPVNFYLGSRRQLTGAHSDVPVARSNVLVPRVPSLKMSNRHPWHYL